MKELAGFAASAGSGFSIHLAGAPWWAVLLVVLVMSCVFLVSLHMSCTSQSNVRAILGAPSVGGPHVWTGFPRHGQLLLKERMPCLRNSASGLLLLYKMTGGAHVR